MAQESESLYGDFLQRMVDEYNVRLAALPTAIADRISAAVFEAALAHADARDEDNNLQASSASSSRRVQLVPSTHEKLKELVMHGACASIAVADVIDAYHKLVPSAVMLIVHKTKLGPGHSDEFLICLEDIEKNIEGGLQAVSSRLGDVTSVDALVDMAFAHKQGHGIGKPYTFPSPPPPQAEFHIVSVLSVYTTTTE